MNSTRNARAQDVDWTKPTAIVFGNEKDGVSQEMLDAADQAVIIPMSGFAQSFNVSVAAAITLHEARESRLRTQGFHASLSEQQQQVLTAVMMLRHLVCLLILAVCWPPSTSIYLSLHLQV